MSERTIRKHKVLQSASLLSLANTSDEQVDSLIFSLTRDRFCVVRDLHPADFEFASYLGIALGRNFRGARRSTREELGMSGNCFTRLAGRRSTRQTGQDGRLDFGGVCVAVDGWTRISEATTHTRTAYGPLLADAERRGQRGSLKAMTNRSIRRRHAQEERSFKKKGAKSPPRSPKRPPEPREKVLVHDTYHHAFGVVPHQKSKFYSWMF